MGEADLPSPPLHIKVKVKVRDLAKVELGEGDWVGEECATGKREGSPGSLRVGRKKATGT